MGSKPRKSLVRFACFAFHIYYLYSNTLTQIVKTIVNYSTFHTRTHPTHTTFQPSDIRLLDSVMVAIKASLGWMLQWRATRVNHLVIPHPPLLQVLYAIWGNSKMLIWGDDKLLALHLGQMKAPMMIDGPWRKPVNAQSWQLKLNLKFEDDKGVVKDADPHIQSAILAQAPNIAMQSNNKQWHLERIRGFRV